MGIQKALLVVGMILVGGCQLASNLPPIRTAESIDLNRFAGDWFVIANIPTFIETDAYNAVESYAEPVNGRVATTFTFNKGGFEGERKTYQPTAFVREGSGNAVWGMQFVWPIKAEYRVVYIDPEYQFTIIGRTKRDYVWLMARQAVIAEDDYKRLLSIIEQEGYDLDKLRLVPQQSVR
ncbi:lipocalin family protein [Gammaproteobacteria bacterium]|jgi:apolipoprotein D and lipocalin family protein|nr:lipocalin family protein [Gammaproteobacteria bacterium]